MELLLFITTPLKIIIREESFAKSDCKYILNNEQLNSGLLSKIHYYLLVAAFQTDVQNAVPKWVRVDEIFFIVILKGNISSHVLISN